MSLNGRTLSTLIRALIVACVTVWPSIAMAQNRPAVETLSSLSPEDRTQVMVLATSHYGGQEGVLPGHFEETLCKLAEFDPEIIAIERIAGNEVQFWQGTSYYSGALDIYVGDYLPLMVVAQAASGLDSTQAMARMRIWNEPPVDLEEGVLIERMMIAISAYELETALLYYWAMGGSDRDEWPSDFPQEIVAALGKLEASTNERVTVAAVLARRLGLSRVRNIDSHLEQPRMTAITPDIIAGIEAVGGLGSVSSQEPYATLVEIEKRSIANGSLDDAYVYVNGVSYGVEDIRAQIDLFNRIAMPNGAGKVRQALWDERNFRIAANLRAAMADAPGKRVLLVIGAGHKPWLDQILAASLELEIVQFNDLQK